MLGHGIQLSRGWLCTKGGGGIVDHRRGSDMWTWGDYSIGTNLAGVLGQERDTNIMSEHSSDEKAR